MASLPRPRLVPRDAPSLQARARDDLRFIRSTMERAAAFTAVPGWGGVLIGLIAFLSIPAAALAPTRDGWILVWICSALVATLVGATDMAHKLRGGGASLLRGTAWRFVGALVPPIVAGACLTFVLARAGLHDLLPGVWLLCYGAGVVSAGTFSIRPVRAMGLCFMVLGLSALLAPASWGDAWMAAGFGGLHVVFGLWIARQHDG